MSINPSCLVGQLVVEQPARARVFEQLGIDYCCGGKISLADACLRHGLDLVSTVRVLEATASADVEVESEDWAAAPLSALCAHIVGIHHGRLRTELPRLSGLLEKVERAHAAGRPDLADVRATFEELRADLEHHMDDEEKHLFPACRAGSSPDPSLCEHLEAEHAASGAMLERLRKLTGDYDLDAALCNTHRATIDGLHHLEIELHRHIHEENNILFPRAFAKAA
jgi:regulator of cell morphogenesis and NO signaling